MVMWKLSMEDEGEEIGDFERGIPLPSVCRRIYLEVNQRKVHAN